MNEERFTNLNVKHQRPFLKHSEFIMSFFIFMLIIIARNTFINIHKHKINMNVLNNHITYVHCSRHKKQHERQRLKSRLL